ncbi:MAG: type II toxin-antitoxin system Phd/YefM family antitoxin [Firmicutes bacterium]|nr:type II toxin-antitoxin system Phd/YefM family antitoxin [Bacillota bacterium]
MPIIRPSSDLRNRYSEISEFCHEHSEPVYITKNGHGDLVVMSIETYERLVGKCDLYKLLQDGTDAMKAEEVRPFRDVLPDIKNKISK